eukprot:EG_transcript_36890
MGRDAGTNFERPKDFGVGLGERLWVAEFSTQKKQQKQKMRAFGPWKRPTEGAQKRRQRGRSVAGLRPHPATSSQRRGSSQPAPAGSPETIFFQPGYRTPP